MKRMVNRWTHRSIKIANAPGYLDKLSSVYNMTVNQNRPLPLGVAKQLRDAYKKKKNKLIITLLLDNAEVFPVKDSYVGFLKAKRTAIDENPKTVKRIAQRLYSFGSFKKMQKEAERPIETNRQLGHRFKDWLRNEGYPTIDESKILASNKGIKVLNGGDKKLRKFAKKYLGCRLGKGIDLVIKVNKKYIIGEAKFLTTSGGEQSGGLRDAFNVISGTSGKALRIAIVDGYVWLKDSDVYEKIVEANKNIMSALVLKGFLKSLK